jgi:hypothetical protein
MRLILALAVGVALAAPASADQRTDLCDTIGEFAYHVMTMRQNGLPQEMVEAFIPADAGPPGMQEALMAIIEAAYAMPRMDADRRDVMIDGYRELGRTVCLDSF